MNFKIFQVIDKDNIHLELFLNNERTISLCVQPSGNPEVGHIIILDVGDAKALVNQLVELITELE